MIEEAAIQIRQAMPEDMEAIVRLWGEMMDEHVRRDPRIRLADGALDAYRSHLGYHLAHSESCVRVAVSRAAVVGFCLLTISRNLPMFCRPVTAICQIWWWRATFGAVALAASCWKSRSFGCAGTRWIRFNFSIMRSMKPAGHFGRQWAFTLFIIAYGAIFQPDLAGGGIVRETT